MKSIKLHANMHFGSVLFQFPNPVKGIDYIIVHTGATKLSSEVGPPYLFTIFRGGLPYLCTMYDLMILRIILVNFSRSIEGGTSEDNFFGSHGTLS